MATSLDAPDSDDDAQSPAADWRRFPLLELSPILRVALAQMVEHGYDATTVRIIAGKVGVTVPALYYHFENKQAMLTALLDRAMAIVTSHVEAALTEAGPDPVARLVAIVEAIVLYSCHHRDIAFLDSERRSLTPVNLAHYIKQRDRVEGELREIIGAGCAGGVFATTDPEMCGRAILTMCQGVAGWYHPAGPDAPEDVARTFARIALGAVEHVER
jgi:AcrR family transcriptional regulator